MKLFRLFLVLGLLAAVAAQFAHAAPVFPGAQGFGSQTAAGRGGRVIRVTTLKGSGPGSLREALMAKGPRIVVFEVGGVIDLERKSITVKEPFLTLAGQTAPAPGITLIRGGIGIQAHDILIQHIRVRPGDAGRPKKSGWSPDGISAYLGDAYNIVIDHCSCTWAIDENLSVSSSIPGGRAAAAHDATFSNCIIAEGLHDSSHEKGPHSKGSLIHDFCYNISIIGNLYAHNVDRNPLFKGNCLGVVVNNMIYNPGSVSIRAEYVPKEYKDTPQKPANSRVGVVGNVLRHGPDTKKGLRLVSGNGLGDIYLRDNIALDREGQAVPLAVSKYTMLKETPAWPEGLKALPASATEESVLKHAGARPAERDAIDQRIIETVRSRTGKVLNSQEEVGGYPKLEPTQRKLDVPQGEQAIQDWLAKMAAEVEGR